MNSLDRILSKLADLITQRRFEEMETDTLEIKPVPSDRGSWHQRHVSVNAFLNTRGGVLLLGVKEVGQGATRRYEFSGYSNQEDQIKLIAQRFTDKNGKRLETSDCFPEPEIRDFLNGQIAILRIAELPADRKFCFLEGKAYRRVLTSDQLISETEIERQEEYVIEALQARELLPVRNCSLSDMDLTRLNEYIQLLNSGGRIETIKSDLSAAASFLERKSFILKDGTATTLGMLVCGKHPSDTLGFRCQVHGYVEADRKLLDKQDFADNILPLMENSFLYVLKNILVGVSVKEGGIPKAQYPEELLRETVNNALAHRDYSINKQATIVIKPGNHIAISNPGSFRCHLLLEADIPGAAPIRRIIPDAKPRNPKLADVLKIYRKWEGRGIGMSTLVNLCLEDTIDLPYYQFKPDEVSLYISAGKLVDDGMHRLLQSFSKYIAQKMEGRELSAGQRAVLAYLIKSERLNAAYNYTILLTPDNNHFNELQTLEKAGLILKHDLSTKSLPVFIVDPALLQKDYLRELRQRFGVVFDNLSALQKDILSIVYRFNNFASAPLVSAKQAAFVIWYDQHGKAEDIREFDALYRQVRNAFNTLEKKNFVRKVKSTPTTGGYELRDSADADLLAISE